MQRRLSLLLLTLAIALPAAGQRGEAPDDGRRRGWDQQAVQHWIERQSAKRAARVAEDCPDFTFRRDAILNGNKITTQIFNFGSISAPGNTITDIVWNGLGYGYEFGPLVAAEIIDEGHRDRQSVPQVDAQGNVVRDAQGDTVWVMHIVSDGLVSLGGERAPDQTEWWGWQPIPCAQPVGSFEGLQVVNPNSDKIPTSDAPDDNRDGRPDSWPDTWYNPEIERYVWPGALEQGASNADKEGLYFMNDYANREFAYDPFPNNPSLRGLGLEVEVRLYQWANPLAEDAIFLIYKITNKSEKDLDKVIFGMWGDPHVGGPSNWQDDLASFDRERNMVFAWDDDGRSDIAGRPPGWFGYKFLESPGVGNEIIDGVSYPGDGIDNDGDGMVDESWTDGIDNDGDWNAETDDVGIDGVDGTGDEGEGDGAPTAGSLFDITKPGEPNFEFTDIDESDQIGLTSFASPPFAGNDISNDERVWAFVQPGRFDDVPEEPGDYVFIYGSGSFRLRAGETKRFSIALIVGENREDLVFNAETVQQIYDVGYRFAKPPNKPRLRAVAGDRKVTLYWDDRAEQSVDPLTGERDFEGYVIYRSTDYDFSDQQTITDVNGSRFLYSPLRDRLGLEAKFDLKNGLQGPASVPYPRRGIAYDLGDDTGLVHTYVDSNNVINGQTYYYTVVAYDRGFTGDGTVGGIPPSETTKTITYDPTTDTYIFDDNTVAVTPAPRVAGYVAPASLIDREHGLERASGNGTGLVRLEVVDEFALKDGNAYRLEFDETADGVVYSVIDDAPVQVSISADPGKFSSLGFAHIQPGTFTLTGADGSALREGQDYTLNAETGAVQVQPGAAQPGETLTATFKYAPLYQSDYLAAEESNVVFDGLHLFVRNDPVALDAAQTGWAEGDAENPFEVRPATAGPGRAPQPSDYEITFADEPVSTGFNNNLPLPFTAVNVTQGNQPIDVFVPDINGNGQWDVNEQLIFIEEVDGQTISTWEVRFTAGGERPGDGDVFFVRTLKPFTDSDAFTFTTEGARADPDLAREELRDIFVVPNPYVATNELEPRNPVRNTERGDRRLYFANVPQQCTIRIYTLAGELVDVIEHNSSLDDGKAFWDLRTKDNMNIAYGLYLFHVESNEGTFIGKFAVIK